MGRGGHSRLPKSATFPIIYRESVPHLTHPCTVHYTVGWVDLHTKCIVYNMYSIQCLKRDSVTRFSTIFLLKRFDLGLIWTGKNGLRQIFGFLQRYLKSGCPRSQRFFLRIWRFSYFKIIAIGCVNTSNYLCLADCSLKICEKPSKFS